MNIVKLKQKMLEHMEGDSFIKELIRVLDISEPTAIKRLNEGNFTTEEIRKMKAAYNLTAEELDEIFYREC